MRSWTRFVWVVTAWLAVTEAGGQETRRPAAEGAEIRSPLPPADPPQRYLPWTPPETSLPGEAVAAVRRLFEIGLPDPRGCEYRALTVTTRPHGRGPTATHGWLIPGPERDKAGRPVARYAICWNGQIHPVAEVGGPADPAADAGIALEIVRGSPSLRPAFASVRVDAPHPVRTALLLRVGDVESAEELYAAGYEGPAGREADQFVLDAAGGWARVAYLRLVAAHRAGDHELGDAIARHFRDSGPAVIAEAARRGVKDPAGRYGYLSQGPPIADAQGGRRQPVERRPRAVLAGRAGYPNDYGYAQALAIDLGEVALDGPPWAGGLYFDLRAEPSVRAMIGLGEEAIPAIEEPALSPVPIPTRIVDRSGRMPYVVSTADVATFAVREVLQGGESSPEDFAAFWAATRGKSARERWKAMLAEEGAPSRQWLVAARWLTQENYPTAGNPDGSRPDDGAEVAALVVDRFRRTIARYDEAGSFGRLATAREFGEVASAADGRAVRPVLGELLERLRAAVLDPPPYAEGETPRWYDLGSLGEAVGRLTTGLAEAGDRGELRRYATWLRTLPTDRYQHFPVMLLSPLWEFPDDPSIAAASEWFFDGEDSPWPARLDGEPDGADRPPVPPAALVRSLLDPLEIAASGGRSPALRIPAFRRSVLRLLRDGRATGETWVEPRADGTPTVQIRARIVGASDVPPSAELGEIVEARQTLRVADLVAWTIRARHDRSRSTVSGPGAPPFSPVWTVARRDAALAEYRAWVRGDRPPAEAGRP